MFEVHGEEYFLERWEARARQRWVGWKVNTDLRVALLTTPSSNFLLIEIQTIDFIVQIEHFHLDQVLNQSGCWSSKQKPELLQANQDIVTLKMTHSRVLSWWPFLLGLLPRESPLGPPFKWGVFHVFHYYSFSQVTQFPGDLINSQVNSLPRFWWHLQAHLCFKDTSLFCPPSLAPGP